MIQGTISSETLSKIPDGVLTMFIPSEYLKELRKYGRQSTKIRVTFSPVFVERTEKQNAIFHAKVNELSKVTGIDRTELKKEIKRNALSMGYPYERDDIGEPIIDEEGYMIPLSSKKASISDMKILIESIYEWTFMNDIDVGEEFYKDKETV